MGNPEQPVGYWVKSSLSFSNGNCVEVKILRDDGVAVRNSRYPGAPPLVFTRAEWEAFLGGTVKGEFTIEALRAASPATGPLAAGEAPAPRLHNV